MDHPVRTYPGKIMLFGEYSIICGSKALVIPFNQVGGRWKFHKNSDQILESIQSSQQALVKLERYLSAEKKFDYIIDIHRFKEDLNVGLYFDSDIPQQYGVGSSGALVAALFDRYKKKEENDLAELKSNLAHIESAFHGNSSGIDPLCCYLNKSIYIEKSEKQNNINIIDNLSFNINDLTIFLIDTKISSSTAPLVNIFRNKLHNYSFYKKINNSYIPIVNEAINDFLNLDSEALFIRLKDIEAFQYEFFDEMIPINIKPLFNPNITKPFHFKLCGSGGGGYILGFTKNPEETKKHLLSQNISVQFL